MSDFLWLPVSDPISAIAGWVTVAAVAATVALFCGTLLLRTATIVRVRRRAATIKEWRGILALAIVSHDSARFGPLPPRKRWMDRYLLEEWNRIADTVQGESAKSLATLAHRLGLDRVARKLLAHENLHERLLAIHSLGYLKDETKWENLGGLAHHPNASLSASAALALVRINPAAAMPMVMAEIVHREDWAPTAVFLMLRSAGAALITQPLCNAILTAKTETAVRLLRYAEMAQRERIEELIEIVLRERTEPAVLAAALRASNSQAGIPRIEALVQHEDWYVRVQAARLLGRVGSKRDLSWMEQLLSDSEWWVRYRAAQAIVHQPFLGPNELRSIMSRQSDRYAKDMMQQAMAEVGLS